MHPLLQRAVSSPETACEPGGQALPRSRTVPHLWPLPPTCPRRAPPQSPVLATSCARDKRPRCGAAIAERTINHGGPASHTKKADAAAPRLIEPNLQKPKLQNHSGSRRRAMTPFPTPRPSSPSAPVGLHSPGTTAGPRPAVPRLAQHVKDMSSLHVSASTAPATALARYVSDAARNGQAPPLAASDVSAQRACSPRTSLCH